jgi:hypothetical protein
VSKGNPLAYRTDELDAVPPFGLYVQEQGVVGEARIKFGSYRLR